MHLFPYARVRLVSPLPLAQLRSRLMAASHPPQFGFTALLERRPEPLVAEFGHDAVRVFRNIDHRNSFLPVFRLTARAEGDRSVIEGRVTLHPFVMAFMGMWMSGACLAVAVCALLALTQGFRAPMLFTLVFPLFGYGLTMFGFWKEFEPTLALLAETLEATPDAPPRSAYRG